MLPPIMRLGVAAAGAALCVTLGSATQAQSKPHPHSNDGHITSPEYAAFLDEMRISGAIPGISVGVVRLTDDREPEVQFASSGRRTEEGGNGHDMTTDVRLASRVADLHLDLLSVRM